MRLAVTVRKRLALNRSCVFLALGLTRRYCAVLRAAQPALLLARCRRANHVTIPDERRKLSATFVAPRSSTTITECTSSGFRLATPVNFFAQPAAQPASQPAAQLAVRGATEPCSCETSEYIQPKNEPTGRCGAPGGQSSAKLSRMGN